jgi:NAD(P)-dependent dehydrogenase (short-subunit alcohol dehydrogenase family)
MSRLRLLDKVILIVGGTSGLGLSAARACVAEGARVVVVGRDAEKCRLACELLGAPSRTVTGDATNAKTCEQAIQLAVEDFGGVDGLYHVAGGSGRSHGDGPLDQISDDGWEFTLRFNLDSMFYSNRAAVRYFLENGRPGSVLNMASVLADSPSPRYFSTHAYATTKAAAVGLTTTAAAYYAPRNIRFNAVAPALVDTTLTQRARNDEDIMRYISTKQPLDGGRIGLPRDADAAAVFFLSDDSRFVTGQVLAIDGGWKVSEGQW